MKKIRNILLFIIALAATVTGLSWWLQVEPVTVPNDHPDWYQQQQLGGYHIHTAASHDCEGSVAELAQAARNNNFQFAIITDHNTMATNRPFRQEGVLFINGTENSTKYGHMVTLKTEKPLTKEEKETPQQSAHALGGWAIAAHPTSLKGAWANNDFSQFDGLEIASRSSDFYRLIIPTNWGKALLTLPALWLFPQTATSLTTTYDEQAWQFFDQELARGHQLLPFCGLDTHQRYDYNWELSGYQLVTLDPWNLLENEKIQQTALLKSLEAGDYYCRAGYLGDIRLNFKANTLVAYRQGGRVNSRLVRNFTAEVFPTPAYPLEFRLYKNGQLVASQMGKLAAEPSGEGGYRLEVWAQLPGLFGSRAVPLFYSTSIILD